MSKITLPVEAPDIEPEAVASDIVRSTAIEQSKPITSRDEVTNSSLIARREVVIQQNQALAAGEKPLQRVNASKVEIQTDEMEEGIDDRTRPELSLEAIDTVLSQFH